VPNPDETTEASGVIGRYEVEVTTVDGRFSTKAVLLDRVGLVTGIEDASVAVAARGLEGVAPAPGNENGFVYGWLGGACDLRTTITFAAAADGSLTLTPSTTVDPGPCIAIAVMRAILVRTSQPVDAAGIVIR